MSYATLFTFFKILFGALIVLGIGHELLWWRTKRRLSKWLTKEFKARKIYIEGEPDPAATRGAVKEFEIVRKMYSGKGR